MCVLLRSCRHVKRVSDECQELKAVFKRNMLRKPVANKANEVITFVSFLPNHFEND